jgi:hypothetical protein
LNALPQVKRFVKGIDNAGVVLYNDVTVNYIPGLPPALILLDIDENELQSIDLSPYSFDQLHELFNEYGFTKKTIVQPTVNESDSDNSQVVDDMKNIVVMDNINMNNNKNKKSDEKEDNVKAVYSGI